MCREVYVQTADLSSWMPGNGVVGSDAVGMFGCRLMQRSVGECQVRERGKAGMEKDRYLILIFIQNIHTVYIYIYIYIHHQYSKII